MMNLMLALVALQEEGDAGVPVAAGIVGLMFFVIFFAVVGLIMVVTFAGAWKMFVKANKPGWAALVPIYNVYTMVEISGKETPLWFFLCLIPVVNFVTGFMVLASLAERFGKSTGFAIGLFLLSPVFIAILGFGDAKYRA